MKQYEPEYFWCDEEGKKVQQPEENATLFVRHWIREYTYSNLTGTFQNLLSFFTHQQEVFFPGATVDVFVKNRICTLERRSFKFERFYLEEYTDYGDYERTSLQLIGVRKGTPQESDEYRQKAVKANAIHYEQKLAQYHKLQKELGITPD